MTKEEFTHFYVCDKTCIRKSFIGRDFSLRLGLLVYFDIRKTYTYDEQSYIRVPCLSLFSSNYRVSAFSVHYSQLSDLFDRCSKHKLDYCLKLISKFPNSARYVIDGCHVLFD